MSSLYIKWCTADYKHLINFTFNVSSLKLAMTEIFVSWISVKATSTSPTNCKHLPPVHHCLCILTLIFCLNEFFLPNHF